MPIGRHWREGSSGEARADTDPYSGDVLAELTLANASGLEEAYQSARDAQPDWAARTPGERAEVLGRAADILTAREEEIVEWLVRETGGTLAKGELEWGLVLGGLREAASRALSSGDPSLPSAVFTRDVERGTHFALRVQAGIGGEKASGIGRFGGDWALEEFTIDHWISTQREPREYPIS